MSRYKKTMGYLEGEWKVWGVYCRKHPEAGVKLFVTRIAARKAARDKCCNLGGKGPHMLDVSSFLIYVDPMRLP